MSMESEEWRHGAFSKAIIEGSRGEADFSVVIKEGFFLERL